MCENDANKLKKIICLQIFFTKLSIEISENTVFDANEELMYKKP